MKTTWNFLIGKKVSNLSLILACTALLGTGYYARSVAESVSQVSDRREAELKQTSVIYRWLVSEKAARHGTSALSGEPAAAAPVSAVTRVE